MLSFRKRSNLSILLAFYFYFMLQTSKGTFEFQIIRMDGINGVVEKFPGDK